MGEAEAYFQAIGKDLVQREGNIGGHISTQSAEKSVSKMAKGCL